MTLPTKAEAHTLLFAHVTDEYQRHHALMVGTALEGYASMLNEDPHLWFLTGYLHDIDFQEFPTLHPGKSLEWFREWHYPPELIHAVEAHALGHNGYTTEPQTKLAAALIACDEICGIFYAYKKVSNLTYGNMPPAKILKRLREHAFAPKISREDIAYGCEKLGITLEAHVEQLVKTFKAAGM